MLCTVLSGVYFDMKYIVNCIKMPFPTYFEAKIAITSLPLPSQCEHFDNVKMTVAVAV